MELKEGDIVMCTVKKIEGTTVFVEIEENGEGSLIISEIAAGRVRNLREYVTINKKIVCKILKISNGHIELSLRRVTGKEREEIQDRYKKEKTFHSLLKTSVIEPNEIIKKIKEKYDLSEFIEMLKEDHSLIASFVNKEAVDKLSKILTEKKEKEKKVKKIFILKSLSESGINEIKYILNLKAPEISVKYLGSSQFSIISSGKDLKDADHKISDILNEIERKAKEKKAFFELKENK